MECTRKTPASTCYLELPISNSTSSLSTQPVCTGWLFEYSYYIYILLTMVPITIVTLFLYSVNYAKEVPFLP